MCVRVCVYWLGNLFITYAFRCGIYFFVLFVRLDARVGAYSLDLGVVRFFLTFIARAARLRCDTRWSDNARGSK